ncbi:MAG: hypothetical protein KAW66_10410, partial [Candidatus Lokiarchaeota archaeon]|nr:hypothetical protein [Candidatus Lokiarchaeota archaeon]
MRKRSKVFLLIGFLSFIFIFQYFGNDSLNQFQDQNEFEIPQLSGDLEGAENILIVQLIRRTNLSTSGLININDKMVILNENDNPINSILIGIPLRDSSNLIYINTVGQTENTLLTERSHGVMGSYEMVKIYFDSPLLPSQETTINVKQTYNNLLSYDIAELEEGVNQLIHFNGLVFPILPYRSEGDVKSIYIIPTLAELHTRKQFNSMGNLVGGNIVYDLATSLSINHLDPFLENLNENNETTVSIKTLQLTGLEIEKINREIFISPWGIIKNTEEVTIENVGIIGVGLFSLNIPVDAKNVKIYDDLGELFGDIINSPTDSSKKVLSIQLSQNRVSLSPTSKFKFFIEYNLPHEQYVSYNWLQQSISINLLMTNYDFLIHEQTTKVVIEGCGTIDYTSSPPEAIFKTVGTRILVYSSEMVSPFEKKIILFTYTVDIFDLILRPTIFIMIIAFLSSIFVLIIKTRKREEDESVFKKEFIPTSEIREFCSLYEEKNALVLEIRNAENETKRKKMVKKTYKNLLTKNTAKIDQIKEEILPFKKILMETSDTYDNIIKKLDILDAERISVNDSLNLLESRYKRGKLPS